MSRVIALFAVFVCALLFVNVCAEDEFSILTADGKYKHDSALSFGKVLKKLEDFTLPEGDKVLEKWIAAMKAVNKGFNAGDMKAVGEVGHGAIDILREILPAIPDKIVYAAIEGLADKVEKEMDHKLTSGSAKLAELDNIIKYAAHTMLDAMSKTKPTAETLN